MPTLTTITVKDLKTAIANVSPAVPSRSSIAILACLRIGAGRIEATDMAAHISVPCDAAGFEPIHVPVKDLKAAIGALKPTDSVTLSRTDTTPGVYVDADTEGESIRERAGYWSVVAHHGKLLIESTRGTVSIDALDAEDWPTHTANLTYPTEWRGFDAADTLDIIRAVSACASSDESRPILTSTRLQVEATGELRVIATDSYRLNQDRIGTASASGTLEACVPYLKAYTSKLKGIDVIEATGGDSSREYVRITEDATDTTIVLRLVEGQYPAADKIVPNGWEGDITADDGLASLGESVAIACKIEGPSGRRPLRLVHDIDLHVSLAGEGIGFDAAVDAQCTVDQPDPFGVRPDFLRDGLAFAGPCIMRLISPLRPILLQSNDRPHRSALIMPTRLSS